MGEDQVRVLEEDSDGYVPLGVRLSLRRLQGLALENNVNFQELVKYALDNAHDEVEKEKNESKKDIVDDVSDREVDEYPSHSKVSCSECCCICLEPLDMKIGKCETLKCGHGFHHNCILEWSDKKFACPLCRQDM